MPYSTATSAQNTTLSVEGTPGTSISITAVTSAVAAVFTATNTLAVGSIVELGTIVGMESLAGTLGIVTVASGTSFTLNIDTSGFGAPGTTGTAIPKTWTKVGNVKDYSGFDGSVTDIDVTNFDSGAMEYRPGLQDFGQFTFNVDVDNTDAGQTLLRTLKTNATTKAFRVVLPNGKIRTFKGYVKKFSETGAVNAVVKAAVDVRITGVVNFG